MNAIAIPNNLLGVEKESLELCVFHDESGDYGHSDWVFTGLLWVREKDISGIAAILRDVRQQENYWKKIHLNELPKSFDGQFGADARVAKEWFTKWYGEIADKTWFNVLAVQLNHPKYDRKRFKQDFHAYNRFTLIALKAGLAWFFKDGKYEHLRLRMYSDKKTRRPGGILGDGVNIDNFEDYIMARLGQEVQSYKGPPISLIAKPEGLEFPNDPNLVRPEHELLCLCDLLVGAVAGAVSPKSKRQTKRWFAKQIAKLMQDVRKKPWEQQMGLHRRFSVSYFPNERGEFYSNGPIGIIDKPDCQLCLFGGS